MAKNKKIDKKDNVVNKIYLAVLGVVTVLFVVALVLVIVDISKPNDFSRIDNISVEELNKRALEGNITSFYVLVYTDDEKENELIAESVASYNKYAEKTRNDQNPDNDALPIVKIKYEGKAKEALNSILPSTLDFPSLITINTGKVETTKTTVSTILQTLQDAQKTE